MQPEHTNTPIESQPPNTDSHTSIDITNVNLDSINAEELRPIDIDKSPSISPRIQDSTDDEGTDEDALLGNQHVAHTLERRSSFLLASEDDKDVNDYWNHSVWQVVRQRGVWLVFLLFIQSFSSFILSSFERLLEKHVIITLFLTMMIGTGGNSGAQSTVLVIRGIATGTITKSQVGKLLWKETRIGLILSILLAAVGAFRVLMYELLRIYQGAHTALLGELFALTLALFCIVWTSVLIGTLLPLFLHYVLKLDAANSSPTVAVIMDIIGVLITVCLITSFN
jgi:Mg/Co/Ni transporter MgtE